MNCEARSVKWQRVLASSCIMLCALCPDVDAQTYKEWDDISVTSLNREPAHTLGIPLGGEDVAEPQKIEESPYYMSLNGVWKFKWVGTPSSKPANFEKPTFNASAWDDIDVPATWQVYGVRRGKNWDKPLYCNVQYPFSYDSNTFSIMADRPGWFQYSGNMKNPVGSYRRTFTVPEGWDGRDVYLRLNGAGHGYYVWVNGQFAGYAEDSYLPSEFNITSLLTEGENTLAVQVYRFTSGSFLECQDYWRLTGITRDVFLWSAPKTQIRDYFATTTLTNNYTTATINIAAELTGADVKGTLTAKLTDGQNVVAQAEVAVAKAGKHTLQMTLDNPMLWSAEEPNLYNLTLALSDGSKTIDVRGQKLGVRQIEINNKGAILVNGQPLLIHGVDRHDFSTEHGRMVPREEMERDVQLMKRLNINAVRTSHYPNNPYFYDLCDQYGLYVLAEADVECHANTSLSGNERFRAAMVERNERHVLWLRNHSCICFWSYGNESGGGNNFEYVEKAIKALDKTRLTHYEGNSTWADVTSTMYASVGTMEYTGATRQNEANQGKKPKPHIQCENTHSMGNSMGNQREYYDLYEKYPALAGEFIWDWKDQALTVPVPNNKSKTYWAYGGDFGDNPNDGNFCCNGVISADYTLTAKAYNVKKIYQPADFVLKSAAKGTFTVKNKMAHRNLSHYAFSYEVLEDGIKISEGTIPTLDIPGGGKQDITLEGLLPETPNDGAEYFVRFSVKQPEATLWCEAGYEVASEQILLREPVSRPVYKSAPGNIEVTETTTSYTLTGETFAATFSKTSGQLSAYKLNGKSVISSGIKFNAFRAPTDNDGRQAGAWKDMGLTSLSIKAGKWTVENDGDNVVLSITNAYNGKGQTSFATQMSYTVMPDGTISVTSLVTPAQKGVILPKMGYVFEMPQTYEQYAWMGRGPWDSYPDRKESCFPGLYHSTVTDQWTDFVLPQETGNKEEVRFISLTSADGTGLMVVAPQRMSTTVGHWHATDIYNDSGRKRHPYEVTFAKNTVVCLDIATRALGNASCGPDVLDQYELRSEQRAFSFMLMPVAEPLTDRQMVERARVAGPQCQPVTISSDKGKVTLSCKTEGATLHYSTDGGETWNVYTAPFSLAGGGTVQAYATADGLTRSMVTEEAVSMFIDKSKWTVYSVDSEQGGGEAAKNCIDNNPSTIWHTHYNPDAPYPHEIIIDMKSTYMVTAFVYEGRSDVANGRVKNYEVYFSNSSKAWGAPAATGSLANSGGEQVVELAQPVAARYMRFIARSEVNGKAWCSAAEIGIQAAQTTDAVSNQYPTVKDKGTYYIKDTESGLYLHSDANGGEGNFRLGKLDMDDAAYKFRFQLATGYSSYYAVRTSDGYMSHGNNWTITLASAAPTDTEGWMQVEGQDDGNCRLRAVWKGSTDYLGLDSHNVGSYVYSDKRTPAIFRLETQTEVGIAPVGANQGPQAVYDLHGRRVPEPTQKGIYVVDGRKMAK